MGILVEDEWRQEELPTETDRAGVFERSDSQFHDKVTAVRGSPLRFAGRQRDTSGLRQRANNSACLIKRLRRLATSGSP
jgi:glutathionyl-hydroquinone reductase